MVAVDGLTWDYDASFQLLVRPYPSIDAYLGRHAQAYLDGTVVREQRELSVAGARGLRFVLAREDRDMVEELTFLEPGDGRVVVVIAECPAPLYEDYRPWFEAVLASLELRVGTAPGDRDYSTHPLRSGPEARDAVRP